MNDNTSQHHSMDQREQLKRATAEALTRANHTLPSSSLEAVQRASSYQKFLISVEPYGDATLHRLITAAEKGFQEHTFNVLVYGVSFDEQYLNDLITVEPFLTFTSFGPSTIINSLMRYERLTPQSSDGYPERREQQVIAITRAVLHLFDLAKGIEVDTLKEQFFIADPELRELITTHEEPGVIADLIIQRDIVDAEQLTTLLDTMSTTPNPLTLGVI